MHDDRGRRWDAYTLEEIIDGGGCNGNDVDVQIQTATSEMTCCCERHGEVDPDIGTRMVWEKTSWECDEWDCWCEQAYRSNWLCIVTTDWVAYAKESDLT